MELQHLVKFQFAMGKCTVFFFCCWPNHRCTQSLQSTDQLRSTLSAITVFKQQKTKNTGGRDLINFKNTHSDKQSPENKSARPILPPSAIPGCVPAADNGCAPLRALYWDDR